MGPRMILLLMTLFLTRCHTLDISFFIKDSICNVQERINYGCTREATPRNIGKLRCVAECRHYDSCIGASVEKDTMKCFIHKMCSSFSPRTCYTPDPNHDYYSSYCVHGHWNSLTQTCQCAMGTFGQRCDKARPNCNDFISLGFSAGLHTFYIDPKQDGYLYKADCHINSNLISIFTLKNEGGISYNRTWNEYVHGFHSDDMTDYWIGLKTWNALSAETGCTEMHLVLKFSGGSGSIYRVHNGFVIGNDAEHYSFTFQSTTKYTSGGIPGPYTAGDCLGSLKDIPFSTWDNDNDGNANKNCPSQVGSGWWHPQDCNNPCNFLGWGLDDWDNTPSGQRLSMLGVDMAQAASQSQIYRLFMYIKCYV